MEFNIAIGKSRNDKRWKNKTITWDAFLNKIKKTHYTAETVADYLTFKKERQDEIKDIGGFVGGYLAGGRRLKTAVTVRGLLTFDADEADPDFWDRFCMLYGCAAAVYSTHKHTPENPRLRLCIPVTRDVYVDEYAAIVRRIAGDMGIDLFDHTGFQPERLMYWPSTSKDGIYLFEAQDGPVLDPDEVLATYTDWADVSEWPVGTREKKVIAANGKKQGEPAEKPGLIGAFNRQYTIEAAIETFLPDVYQKTDIEDRYTFLGGSTAAGVIVYDNKFSFSHHSTDPASGLLCNAFDLVRLHKYNLLDIDSEAPINKLPSYLAMSDFAGTDPGVKMQLGEARLAAAKDAFAEIPSFVLEVAKDGTVTEKDATDWLKMLDVDRKGNYLVTINNIALILEFDPVFKGNFAYDEFEQQAVFKNDVPWRKVKENKTIITDNDLANIENYIEKVYKIKAGTTLNKGILVVMEKFKFHPVRDYLNGLVWDGTDRVETILIEYLGCGDNEYTRTVTRKSIVACVARVMSPGIKFDYVLTLVGEEGQGKSQLWDVLGGKWFSDTFNMHMLQGKEAYEQIQGVWIIEIGELAGMAKAEVEKVKGFLSARSDRYRPPYLRTVQKMPRQNVFFASTNTFDFLKSQNGNRRFWPVSTFENLPEKNVYDIDEKTRGQIWAEAVTLYRKKEKLFLSEEVTKLAKEVQEFYTEENPLQNTVEHFLEYKIPSEWYNLTKWEKISYIEDYENLKDKAEEREKVCLSEIWEVALGKRDHMTMADLRNLKTIMGKIKGWDLEKEVIRFGTSYPRQRNSYKKSQVAQPRHKKTESVTD